MKCQDCGAENLDGAARCNTCGAALQPAAGSAGAGRGHTGLWIAVAAAAALVVVLFLMFGSGGGSGGGGSLAPSAQTSPSGSAAIRLTAEQNRAVAKAESIVRRKAPGILKGTRFVTVSKFAGRKLVVVVYQRDVTTQDPVTGETVMIGSRVAVTVDPKTGKVSYATTN